MVLSRLAASPRGRMRPAIGSTNSFYNFSFAMRFLTASIYVGFKVFKDFSGIMRTIERLSFPVCNFIRSIRLQSEFALSLLPKQATLQRPLGKMRSLFDVRGRITSIQPKYPARSLFCLVHCFDRNIGRIFQIRIMVAEYHRLESFPQR